jgi:glycosyltransferase involved in cell wall biosynthesis
MRLFYINYADLSVAYGATVCIVELAKALARQGHEVTVIVPQFKRNPLPPDGFDLLTIPNRDIRFLRKVWFYLASAFWVTLWALRKRPDILYWGEMTYTITPYLVSKLTGHPLRHYRSRVCARRIEGFTMANGDCQVVPKDLFRQRQRRHYRHP